MASYAVRMQCASLHANTVTAKAGAEEVGIHKRLLLSHLTPNACYMEKHAEHGDGIAITG